MRRGCGLLRDLPASHRGLAPADEEGAGQSHPAGGARTLVEDFGFGVDDDGLDFEAAGGAA